MLYAHPEGRESWTIPFHDDDHPTAVARSELSRIGFSVLVLHGTSWRYADGHVILTYAAALGRERPPDGYEWLPVRDAPIVHGDAVVPPAVIEVENVLTHALRHLAWLALHDAPIRAQLPRAWHDALSNRLPTTARMLT